jgi:gluconate kinase
MLKEELVSIYIRVSDFYDAAFRDNDGLEPVKKMQEGISLSPNEEDSWREWPESAKESEVLDWLSKVINVVSDIASEESFT